MRTVTFDVPDISCAHCERAITQALSPLDGVERVRVDIAARQVCVTYEPARTAIEQMQAILTQEDYPASQVR